MNGFGLSHVGAYAGWSALRGDALRWWEHYRHAFQVTEVTQCSVRFVNWIDVPVATELSTLLLTRVEVGPLLPQALGESFFRVVLPFGDNRHAAITQATAPPDQRTSLCVNVP